MRRLIQIVSIVLLLALAAVPPWLLVWQAPASGDAPIPEQVAWGGFHGWGFADARPTKTIAWDGRGTGGKQDLVGVPRLHAPLWLGMLCLPAVTGLLAFGVGRRRATQQNPR